MKILFATLHWGYLRNFESVIRRLATEGHELLLVADIEEGFGNQPLIDELRQDFPKIRIQRTPMDLDSYRLEFTTYIRHGIHYLRLLEPEYADRDLLRRSMARRTPDLIVNFGHRYAAKGQLGRLAAWLRRLEKAVRVPPEWITLLERERPDLLLVTPLVGMSESQFDPLRAAHRTGTRSIFCAAGWDHLSSKALIRFDPGRVFVWNETQKAEAVEMHGVAPERIEVAGAPGFDKWFDRKPGRAREQFCSQVGLDPTRPYLVYLCSCLFRGSPSEAEYVVDWIRRMRASEHSQLRDVGILIRPHPQRRKLWKDVDLSDLENVAFWGDNPVEADSQADFYDSMVHSVAAIGLNTTALIDAAVVGKPVHTILLPRFHENQAGTIHFHYLLNLDGGMLYQANNMAEHLRQLADSVARGGQVDPRSRRFTEIFVRPCGMDIRSTDVFVAALQRHAATPIPAPTRSNLGDFLLRYAALYPLMAIGYVVTFAPLRRFNAVARKKIINVVRGLASGLYLRTIEKKLVPRSYILVRSFWRIDTAESGRFKALFGAAGGGKRLGLPPHRIEIPPPNFLLRYLVLYPFVYASYSFRLLAVAQSATRIGWHRLKKRVRFVALKLKYGVKKARSLLVRLVNRFRRVSDA